MIGLMVARCAGEKAAIREARGARFLPGHGTDRIELIGLKHPAGVSTTPERQARRGSTLFGQYHVFSVC